jgi:two-component system chemotaxis response regulator CheY
MPRILVIDDEPGVRNLLGRFLRSANFEVSFAEDGLEGLEKVKSDPPDLIVADVAMPNLDGITLCSMLKKDPATSNIPFLIITGHGTIGEAEEALQEKPDGYLTKPFELSRVLHKIESLLGQ